MILNHASVPDLTISTDGRLRVYYVNGEPGKHGIFAARQSDDGAWEVVDCVKLDGRFERNVVAPDITRLADGRYRLVYFWITLLVKKTRPGEPLLHPIYSAISEDGIHFILEQQLIAVEGITDPSVVQLPAGFWLIGLQRQGTMVLVHSDDGTTYTLLETTFQAPGISDLGSRSRPGALQRGGFVPHRFDSSGENDYSEGAVKMYPDCNTEREHVLTFHSLTLHGIQEITHTQSDGRILLRPVPRAGAGHEKSPRNAGACASETTCAYSISRQFTRGGGNLLRIGIPEARQLRR